MLGVGLERETLKKFHHADLVINWTLGWGLGW